MGWTVSRKAQRRCGRINVKDGLAGVEWAANPVIKVGGRFNGPGLRLRRC
jgi:hypothetical protein